MIDDRANQPTPNQIWSYLYQFAHPYIWFMASAVILLIINAGIILSMGMALRFFIDQGLASHNLPLLNKVYISALLVALVFATVAFARTLLTGWLGEKIVADIKQRLFEHILFFNRHVLDNIKINDLVVHFSSDGPSILTFISNSSAVLIRSLLQAIGAIVLLWLTSTKLTLLTFLIVPIVILPLRIIGRSIRCQSDQVHTIQTSINSFIQTRLDGLTDIQLFQNEPLVTRNFHTLLNTFLTSVRKRLALRSLLIAIVIFMLFMAIATVVWIGGHDVMSGKMTAGSLTSFVFYGMVVGGSLNQITELIGEGQMALSAFSRIVAVLHLKTPASLNSTSAIPSAVPSTKISTSIKSVEFKNISFNYAHRNNHDVLNDICLTILQGQQVAIVGPSGAGKSTLLQLLTCLYMPTAGQIWIDNQDLSTMDLYTVRQMFSIVPQNPTLFDTTVYDNIAFGNPAATHDQVMYAAQQAGVMEFISQLPARFDTVLDVQGLNLSSGQRQRIILARALLRDAPILLMDEATNALDALSERIIQENLDQLRGHKTMLMIAHRLSTVISADRIIVMDHGKIVQQGLHHELILQPGLYKTLATKQFLQ